MNNDLPDGLLDATLQQIILDSRHPTRKLAARLIEACRTTRAISWQSDAERKGLPRVNIVDTGARLLQRDTILAHDHHERRLGRKV